MSVHASPNIVEDGLVLCLDAGNGRSYGGTGTTWYDLSGNGHHFILYNSPTSSINKIVFDGTNQYARSQNTIDLSYTQTVSVFSMWKMNVTAARTVYEFSPNWNSYAGSFGFLANSLGGGQNNPIYCHVQSRGNVSYSGLNIVTDDTRNNKIFTAIHDFFSPAPETTVYESDSLSPIYSSYNANNTGFFRNDYLYIASRGGSSSFANVDFYGILIYDRRLSEDEIKQNFNALRGRFGL